MIQISPSLLLLSLWMLTVCRFSVAWIPTRATASTRKLTRAAPTALSMSKVYAPSRTVTYDDKKYRLCAAAAVLNSQGNLLVGERTSIKNAWQAPQGGVDGAWEENNHQEETIVQAASRELFEEMGLTVGEDVVLDSPDDCAQGIRYETTGTTNWLTKAGFSGQELHWVLYRCIDGRGDQDSNLICDLTGQNGEAPEFTQVAWRPISQVIEEMWPAKRGPYEALQSILEESQSTWSQHCQDVDFAGTWSRDNSLSQNLKAALQARGLPAEEAKQAAEGPYKQIWTAKESEWTVTTYSDDGVTPRRTLLYLLGEWEETYQGKATLFGDSQDDKPATLHRRTFYAPQGDTATVAHVTISKTPKGDTEESCRYRDGDFFVLKRTFWAKDNVDKGVVSTEFFRREA